MIKSLFYNELQKEPIRENLCKYIYMHLCDFYNPPRKPSMIYVQNCYKIFAKSTNTLSEVDETVKFFNKDKERISFNDTGLIKDCPIYIFNGKPHHSAAEIMFAELYMKSKKIEYYISSGIKLETIEEIINLYKYL